MDKTEKITFTTMGIVGGLILLSTIIFTPKIYKKINEGKFEYKQYDVKFPYGMTLKNTILTKDINNYPSNVEIKEIKK